MAGWFVVGGWISWVVDGGLTLIGGYFSHFKVEVVYLCTRYVLQAVLVGEPETTAGWLVGWMVG